jgi:hypothetical protein
VDVVADPTTVSVDLGEVEAGSSARRSFPISTIRARTKPEPESE